MKFSFKKKVSTSYNKEKEADGGETFSRGRVKYFSKQIEKQ